MTTSMIRIASIEVGNRLRVLDPAWVNLLAEEIAAEGHKEPIRVVPQGDTYRLISGARRIAAIQQLGHDEIEARIELASKPVDDATIRLAEIKADLMRADLTVLDRARYVSAWREIHEALHPQPKRGRKPANAPSDPLLEMSAQCANIFTEAAKAAFGFSQRTIYLLLKIATIDAQVARSIALHSVANKRGELLILAEYSPVLQASIASMLTSDPAKADSVTEALILLNATPPLQTAPVYERLSEKFSRLPEKEQFAFFAMHEGTIDLWLAQRSFSARKVA